MSDIFISYRRKSAITLAFCVFIGLSVVLNNNATGAPTISVTPQATIPADWNGLSAEDEIIVPTPTPTPTPTPLSLLEALEQGKFRVVGQKTGYCSGSLSPDETVFAVADDGVYRVSDGQKLFNFSIYHYGIPIFSPDGVVVAIHDDGVYRVSDGKKLFSISRYQLTFSPDGALLVIIRDGVYQVSDGQKLFDIGGYPKFSPDGSLLAVSNDGLYQVSDGQKRFDIMGDLYNPPVFSPDGTLLAVNEDGIYRVSDGEKLFDVEADIMTFSPDGTLLVVKDRFIWMYRVNDGKKLFRIYGEYITFSPDGTLMAVSSDGVYRLEDNQRLFGIGGRHGMSFSSNGALLGVNNDYVYRVSDGQKLFEIEKPYEVTFNPDGTVLGVNGDGVYRVSDGQKLLSDSYNNLSISASGRYLQLGCHLLVPDEDSRILSGQLLLESINLRSFPSLEGAIIEVVRDKDAFVTIFGVDPTGDWYYTSLDGWIASDLIRLNGDRLMLPVILP